MSNTLAADRDKSIADAYAIPLEKIDVSDPELFRTDTMWPYFERLRHEDPVHYCKESEYGPFWSVTKYKDIMHVDTNHGIYSSEATLGGVALRNQEEGFFLPTLPSCGISASTQPSRATISSPCWPKAKRRKTWGRWSIWETFFS